MKKTVICLFGPSGAGKTDLALALYREWPLDIISVDSVMVYRGMDIGSAKPSSSIRAAVPHALIDIRDPCERYSAGAFCEDVKKEIEKSLSAGRTPLLVGGTMLYFHALQAGMPDLPSASLEIKQHLLQEKQEKGLAALHATLLKCDPIAANRIHPNDPQRILRALEVFYASGKPLSAWWTQDKSRSDWHYENIAIVPDRASLSERIAARFHLMLEQGLIDEVAKFYARGDLSLAMPSMRSVGYKEVWQYLAGEFSYETMCERAIIATRQLAKRQYTWLNKWPQAMICESDFQKNLEKILKYNN